MKLFSRYVVSFVTIAIASITHCHATAFSPQPSSLAHQHQTQPRAAAGRRRRRRSLLKADAAPRTDVQGVRGGDSKKITGGDASFASSIFNLVNNVAGAGILTLSSGMAAGTGWIPAMLICAVLGGLSTYTFCLVGEACERTGEADFKGLWARTIGPSTTYMVDSIIAIMCLAAGVIYSGILGDVWTPLLKGMGLPDKFNGRNSNIIIITLVALLPMSLIKNLSALAFTSILGFVAILYTVAFIIVRSMDGTYSLGTGKFVLDGVIATPTFTKSSMWGFGLASLVLTSNLSLAYVAHYNAPAFYRELKDTSAKRFSQMVNLAFAFLTTLYILTMFAGYSTFGDVTQGNILLSYHPSDFLSTLGRAATGFSILFGFPLVAKGARESLTGFLDGVGFPIKVSNHHVPFVACMLAFITAISITVQDVSLVVGLTGAVMGSLICYVVPTIIYTKAIQLTGSPKDYQRAKWNNYLLIPFGIATGTLGVFMTIQDAMGK